MLDLSSALSGDLAKAGAGIGVGPYKGYRGIDVPGNLPLVNALSQYAQNAGVDIGLPNYAQANNPNAPQGPVTVGGVLQGQQAGNQTSPNPAGSGSFNAQNQANKQAVAAQNQQNQGVYALNGPQQQLLNQQIDTINKQMQTDISGLQEEYAKRGITDPRAINAGVQQLQEHYQGLSLRTSTDFYNQIAQEKQQALAALTQTLTGLQEAGVQGLTNTGAIHEQTAAREQSFGADLLGGLLGGGLNLLGFGLGGGFGGQSSAPVSLGSFPPVDYGAALSQGGAGLGDLYTNLGSTLAGPGIGRF